MVYANCRYCNRRFILKTKKGLFGKIKRNYVILSEQSERLIYAHIKCYKRYKRAKIKKERKLKLKGGINIGVANMGVEY